MSEQPVTKKKKGLGPLAWIAIGCGGLVLLVGVGVVALGIFAVGKAKDVAQEISENLENNPALTIAEGMVRLNPDLELLSKDVEAGTLTVLNRKTGDKVTMDASKIADGKLEFTGPDGKKVSVGADQDTGLSVTTDDGKSFTMGSDGEGGLAISGPEGEIRMGKLSEQDLPDWMPLDDAEFGEIAGYTHPKGLSGVVKATFPVERSALVDRIKQALEEAGMEVTVVDSSGAGPERTMIFGTSADKQRSFNADLQGTGAETTAGIQFSDGAQ